MYKAFSSLNQCTIKKSVLSKVSEVTQRKFLRRAMQAGVVAMLFLFSLATAAPAVAQDSKLSEAQLSREMHEAHPLTIHRAAPEQRIADRYIVLFNDSVANPHEEGRNMVTRESGKMHFTYGHAVKGFAATLTPDAVERLRHDPRVALIEEDRAVHTTSMAPPPFMQAAALPTPLSPQIGTSWALDRIDQRNLPLDNSFSFPASAGAGVHLYMIDSGMLGGIFGLQGVGSHVEFAGRVGDGADFVDPSTNGADCLGHGTFGASLAGGTTLGVAKLVTFHPVRVINCGDGGSASGVIAGVNWVTSDHLSHPGQKSVANMSLTLNSVVTAVDQAVQNSINAGVVYVIAAGNNGPSRLDFVTGLELANACNISPQRVGAAITVGAMQNDLFPDAVTGESDFGGCVDLYAPGRLMTGASIASTTAITGPPFDSTIHHGTSWSAPLVAGVAATYLAAHPNANQSQVVSAIVSNSTINVLSLGPQSAFSTQTGVVPNRLLYSDFQTDIQTTVSSNFGAPGVGTQVRYTFQVHNNGPFNSMDPVLFTDNLPAGMSVVGGAASTRGSCSGNTNITCDLGRLAVGEQAVITIAVNVPFTPQSFTNTGTATLQSGQTDRAPANNSASLTLTSH